MDGGDDASNVRPGARQDCPQATGEPPWVEPRGPAARLASVLERRLPLLMVAPALALVLAMVVYPLVWAVKLSLFRVSIVDLDAQSFVGLVNYLAVLTAPVFSQVVWNTVVFVGASVVGQVAVGLGLALLLDGDWPGDRVTRALRATFVLPWATTGVVVAYSWQFMFAPRAGLVNGALRWLGVASPPTWLHSVEWAMVALVVANVWRGAPFSLVVQTSGLQRVPDALTEAAAVAGASRLQTVRHVTLPLLRPFVAMNLLLVALFTVNVFDIILVMTGGGPLEATEVVALHMYELAFQTGAFGQASALAVVLFAVNLGLTGLYLRLSSGREALR